MDVYDVNEDLVKALVKLGKIGYISKEFAKIQKNHDKIRFVENLLKKYGQFSKLDLKINPHADKNDEKSLNLRQEGNKYFSLKSTDYHKAMELYNKSICFAENDSDNISIGYANRSAILFKWKRYKECLENIKLAKDANYPKNLYHKLEKRENDCLEELIKAQAQIQTTDTNDHDDEMDYDEFKLTYDRHPKVPFIADCLDMNSDKVAGRYIYTKRDLNPGDVVAIEDPYCSLLLPSLKYSRCANCTVDNYYTLIPCPNCTCAMFCSKKCLEDATNSFHKYECPIIDVLHEIFTKINLISLRVVLVTITNFPNINECIEFCENEKNQNQNSFTLDYDNFTKIEYYRAIHGLVTNQEKREASDLFQRAVTAAILNKYIIEKTPLKHILTDDKKENFFLDLLYRHLQTSSSNMHSIDLVETKIGKDEGTYASVAYAFFSLLNHSCAPNIIRVYRGTQLLIMVLRPINANGILYDNYGYHFAILSKQYRQQNLNTQYRFKCNCEACENDYPLYDKLLRPSVVPDIIVSEDFERLMELDKLYARKNLKRYFDYLKKYCKYFPCVQINATEEALKRALNIIVDAVSLKLKH